MSKSEQLEEYMAEVNISTKLVATSIQNKLIPIAHRLLAEGTRNEASYNESKTEQSTISETHSEDYLANQGVHALSILEKEEISSGFSAVAGLLDGLWHSMRAEYSMNTVVPIDIPSDPSPPIPTVLSTMMTSEELDEKIVEDPIFQQKIGLTNDEERGLEELIKAHSYRLEEIVEELSRNFQEFV